MDRNKKNEKIKTFLIIIIVIVIFSGPYHIFSALVGRGNPFDYSFKINHGLDQITGIYLVDAISSKDYEILCEIPLEEKENLINEFTEFIYYRINISTKPNTVGKAFLIKYNDGCYDLVSRNYPSNCVIENDDITVYCYKCGLSEFNDAFDQLLVKYLIN